MNARQERVNVARFLSNAALLSALTGVAASIIWPTLFAIAALLVLTGIGLRLEAAILDRA
jgi:hypothetical protein